MKEQFAKLVAKLKTLDKKVWIIAGAAAVAVAALVITLVLVLGGGEETPTGGDVTATTTTAVTTTTKVTTTTTTATTTTTTKATTTTTVATTTTTAATTAATQPTNSNGGEVLGLGSESEPYLETPAEDMTVTTVGIPAGSSRFYAIYRTGNKILTIYSANAYVVCDGVRYDANGGVVSFTVPDVIASDAVLFEIGNSGSSEEAFTVCFSNPKGSVENPEVIGEIGGQVSVSLPKDASQGYYYRYVATRSGTIRFYMTASVDSVMYATRVRDTIPVQRSTEGDALSDAQGTYIELEVQAGDEITVNVAAKPNKRGKFPAVDITWFGQYV